ncbi:F-box/WD repeat-containing protein 5-like [Dreissena polymorpha]|uniref:F-box domain-containing protein n=1 Tax=Dreissena polymorpha TaxID=45954 RepID=A0A9D4KCA6_DREPO|nr:F-box/WD repeat-containing protein 5-like [Dreissena polymorpha]KAH3836636.1 hypothetical protein DPMN_110007 [Dreissena polymorpha]
MPLLCFQERKSPINVDGAQDIDIEDAGSFNSCWQDIPDSLLLYIFSFLDVEHLGKVGSVCRTWQRIALDETLWRRLFYSILNVSPQPLAPGKSSWREEVKRIQYETPLTLTETLTDHTDEVLHVSFSHDGCVFGTTSKDASLKIWEVGYPTRLKYSKDFRQLLKWDFTQFCAFNQSDTMILVSSVKSSSIMDRRGYMAILSLVHDFQILRVVTMDPSQMFGAWLDDQTFLGGTLEISLDRFATTVQIEAHKVCLTCHQIPDKVTQVEDMTGRPLFTFTSETASLIKFLTVSRVLSKVAHPGQTSRKENENNAMMVDWFEAPDFMNVKGKLKSPTIAERSNSLYTRYKREYEEGEQFFDDDNVVQSKRVCRTCGLENSSVEMSKMVCDTCETKAKIGESQQKMDIDSLTTDDWPFRNLMTDSSISPRSTSTCVNCIHWPEEKMKNLIYVTGEFAVALHQIGFKNIPTCNQTFFGQTGSVNVRSYSGQQDGAGAGYNMVVNYSNNDVHLVQQPPKPDSPDQLMDLSGHVTGLCLTPDQRFLYINCRPWIGEIDRTDPWATPELSHDIEVRVIDLVTLTDLGIQYKGHKGFSPSNMCCFVFLDVCNDFVASGSEDAKGYIWDRHYRTLLGTYEHEPGVVNAVAFNPVQQQYLVTVSDDKTIKIWRSKSEVKRLGIGCMSADNDDPVKQLDDTV